MLVTLGKYHL